VVSRNLLYDLRAVSNCPRVLNPITYRSVVGLGNEPVIVHAADREDARLLGVHALGVGIERESSRGREQSCGVYHCRCWKVAECGGGEVDGGVRAARCL
jgi:hypothetical protein